MNSRIILKETTKSITSCKLFRRKISLESSVQSIVYSTPITAVQSGLISAHNFFGTGSWALDIIAGAIFFRTFISFPLGTLQRTIITSHSIKLRHQIDQLRYNLSRGVRTKEISSEEATNLAKENLIHLTSFKRWFDPQYNTFAKVAPVFLTEISLWICYSIALRNTVRGLPPYLSEARLASSEMRNEGIGWITDLTLSDPLFLLPCITVLTTFTSLKVSRKKVKNFKS